MKTSLSSAVTIFLALLTISLPVSTKAQQITWALDGGDPNFHVPKALYCDNSGHIIVAGEVNALQTPYLQLSNAPTITSRGHSDVFVAHMNEDSTVNWIKQIGGADWDVATDVIADAQGNVYVCGLFDDSLWVDNMHLISEGLTDLFMAKFSSSGTLLWLKQIKSTGDQYYYPSLAADNNQNIFLAGSFSTDTDFGDGTIYPFAGGGIWPKDAFLSKYDMNGSLSWVKIFQSTESENITSTAVGTTGEVYVAGTFIDSLSVDTANLVSAGGEDIFLARFSTNGDLNWVKTYGNSGDDEPGNIVTTNNGQLLMSATFQDSITVDTMQFICAPQDAHNLLLARIDTTGNTKWARSHVVEIYEPKADINDSGIISFSGEFLIQAHLDGFVLTSAQIGDFDGFIAVCDTNGVVTTAFQAMGSEEDEYMHDMDMDNDGNIYSAGVTTSPAVFWGPFLLPASLFILKISPEELPTGIPATGTATTLEVYPNPTSGIIQLSTEIKTGTIKIYNMHGSLVMQVPGASGTIDMSSLPASTYLLVAQTDAGIVKQLVIKQ